ncbi:DNA-directed RNA polymerase II subunit RPB1-like isoform X2 [Hylaeus anthracinus]|uniref:DNA-directed RNA polymerase II subunit RPB1-like isoform X2 n=1 Tax=Hylaeus anthracinus TaxID=313031 RepID=UPI0023B8D586|nr:DNA-directed RNA polymerase II subunit RPB1-like isoform X2 [Hylaeus anthracinus]
MIRTQKRQPDICPNRSSSFDSQHRFASSSFTVECCPLHFHSPNLVNHASEAMANDVTATLKVYVTLLAIAVILVASTESKPTWPHQLYFSSYQYPSAAVSGQSQLHHYRDTYSPYYVYNVHTHNPQLPEYNFFYGTPTYDFRFPLSPFYPAPKPSESSPGSKPTPTTPTSTDESTEGKDDKVEKLDTKVESEKEDKKSNDVHTQNPQLPEYNFFYGTPVYDFRFPLSPFYPALKPSESSPGSKPTLTTSTSKDESTEGKDDKVEKLDTKVVSEKKEKNLSDTEDKNDNDSITVDSI